MIISKPLLTFGIYFTSIATSWATIEMGCVHFCPPGKFFNASAIPVSTGNLRARTCGVLFTDENMSRWNRRFCPQIQDGVDRAGCCKLSEEEEAIDMTVVEDTPEERKKKSESDTESDSESEPETQPESEPEPEPEVLPEAEPEVEPEVEPAPAPEPVPEPASVPAPVPVPAQAQAPAPAPEPEPEPVPELDPNEIIKKCERCGDSGRFYDNNRVYEVSTMIGNFGPKCKDFFPKKEFKKLTRAYCTDRQSAVHSAGCCGVDNENQVNNIVGDVGDQLGSTATNIGQQTGLTGFMNNVGNGINNGANAVSNAIGQGLNMACALFGGC